MKKIYFYKIILIKISQKDLDNYREICMDCDKIILIIAIAFFIMLIVYIKESYDLFLSLNKF